MRASDLLGRTVYDDHGNVLGRIADLLVTGSPDGSPTITELLITRRRLRLFGYERDEVTGPWIIERLAKRLQGPAIRVPYAAVHLTKP